MNIRQRRRIRLWVGVFLAVAAAVAIVASNQLPGFWYEVTRPREHTPSPGTRSLLSAIRQPITLHLYFPDEQTRAIPALHHYAGHVRTMLEEFAVESQGKISFEVIDPRPSSAEEGRARQEGIAAASLSAGGKPIYFGLVGSNSLGATAAISFLPWDPRKEALLEHDLARVVYKLATPAGRSGDWRYATLGGKVPLVIAHRGASGLFPEHTIPGYQEAIQDGADCIEPDLVMTKDGALVDRHDVFLSTTTDIARHPEFASRKRKGTQSPYTSMEDWYVSDFTLAELKKLRTIQPFVGRSPAFDGLYPIPTFAEVLDTALASRTVGGAPVCVYPEAKEPSYHMALGFDVGGEILRVLKEKGLDKPGSPIFIQSFEPAPLKVLAAHTRLPLVLLVMDQQGLDAAMKIDGAPFWQVLGARHQMLFDWRGRPTGVIQDAHRRGILVHSWTYRDDDPFWGEDAETSMKKALALGLDGFFTDFPFTGYRVVNDVLAQRATAVAWRENQKDVAP